MTNKREIETRKWSVRREESQRSEYRYTQHIYDDALWTEEEGLTR
jgi:hypothetical protein